MIHSLIKEATTVLLQCDNNFLQLKKSVDILYQEFSTITGVKIEQLSEDKNILLPSGKAIGIAGAAHCLLEMQRTAVFLRGINKAISQKLFENPNKRIRILYAGTGPFGTLVIPLLTLYKPDEIIIDLLEINPDSLAALRKVIEVLNLHEYIGDVYCTDATTFRISQQYDIAISETMLACLKSEPQVAIMLNLIPQLTAECLFIPEEISIDACLTNPKMEQDRMMYIEGEKPLFERWPLGNVFTVSKQNMNSITEKKTFLIPDDAVAAFPVLKLFTTVTVYNKEMLTENDSSITLTKQFYDFRVEKCREVEFIYIRGEKPQIESSVARPVVTPEIVTI